MVSMLIESTPADVVAVLTKDIVFPSPGHKLQTEMVKNKVCRHLLVQLMHWRYLVLDEGHIIKNEASEISQVVRYGLILLSILLLAFHLTFIMSPLLHSSGGCILVMSFF